MLDEPYGHVAKPDYQAKRHAWSTAHGFKLAIPVWEGLYNPGSAVPHFLGHDVDLLDRVIITVERLGTNAATAWDFQSANFSSQFVSPARAESGKSGNPPWYHIRF